MIIVITPLVLFMFIYYLYISGYFINVVTELYSAYKILNTYVIIPVSNIYVKLNYYVFYKNKLKNGIANFGQRPTFKGKKPLLEVNIFGFNKNLYKKELEIEFKKFIRKEKKFNNILQLKKQIKMDIKKAK